MKPRSAGFGRRINSTGYLDWSKAERVRLPNLEAQHNRDLAAFAGALLERIKVAANKRDVTYQSLIKTWLAEKLEGHSGTATLTPPPRATSIAPRQRTRGGR